MIKKFNSAQEINDYVDSKIHGSFLVSDIEFLGTYVGKLKSGDKYAEVGTGHGKSTASAIWQAPKGVKFVTLDIADLPSPALDKLSRQQFFEEEEFDRVCTFIQGESSEVAKGWPDNYFSMIFVDGEHTYEDGKADILAWSPKLKSGGWMLFHDYSDSQFTLVRSIDELVRDSGEFTDFRVAKNLGFGISSMAGAVKK